MYYGRKTHSYKLLLRPWSLTKLNTNEQLWNLELKFGDSETNNSVNGVSITYDIPSLSLSSLKLQHFGFHFLCYFNPSQTYLMLLHLFLRQRVPKDKYQRRILLLFNHCIRSRGYAGSICSHRGKK